MTPSKRMKTSSILTYDCTSSDESEYVGGKCIKYHTRVLKWESRRMLKIKRQLDGAHVSSLSQAVQARILPRFRTLESVRRCSSQLSRVGMLQGN